MKTLRRAHAAAGALIIAVPSPAVALSAGKAATQGSAQSGSSSAIRAKVRSRHLAYGQDVFVTGSAPSSDAGHNVQLQFNPGGRSSWRALTSTKVGANGHFHMAIPLRRSGLVKVVDTTAPATVPIFGAHAAAA